MMFENLTDVIFYFFIFYIVIILIVSVILFSDLLYKHQNIYIFNFTYKKFKVSMSLCLFINPASSDFCSLWFSNDFFMFIVVSVACFKIITVIGVNQVQTALLTSIIGPL